MARESSGPVETLQPSYHMFRRDIEAEILPYTEEEDIGVLVYGPLAHGLLSGAMTPRTSFAGDDGEATARTSPARRSSETCWWWIG
jgi:aryl-alcohol dehydrogenase-like predicted oxidoreductase